MQLVALELDAGDRDAARAFERSLVTRGRELPDDVPFLTWMAGASLARAATRVREDLVATWRAEEGSWPPALELRHADDRRRHLFVAVEPSSMEPRPVWPMTVRVDHFAEGSFDGAIGCYVPKRSRIEAAGTQVPRATVVGWLPAERVRRMPIVDSAPHPGHPFPARYYEERCSRWAPLGTLHKELFADDDDDAAAGRG